MKTTEYATKKELSDVKLGFEKALTEQTHLLIGEFDKLYDYMDKRFERIESEIGSIKGRLSDIEARLTRIETRLDKVDERDSEDSDSFATQILELKQQLVDTQKRVAVLEAQKK